MDSSSTLRGPLKAAPCLFNADVAARKTADVLAIMVTWRHQADVSDLGFITAVDQMAEVGFDMLIFSFGSGFNLESADPQAGENAHEHRSTLATHGLVLSYDGSPTPLVVDRITLTCAQPLRLPPPLCLLSPVPRQNQEAGGLRENQRD